MGENSLSAVEEVSFDFILNSDTSLANALRRTMIGRIPSYAIDTVCIKENDSPVLCDEFIAHRLGMIPLRYEGEESIIILKVKLAATGPCKVYSRDLVFNTECIKPVSPDIFIMELGKEETIDLFGQIEKGNGSEHAKWNVSCGTSYKKLGDDKFQFHIETTGALTAKETFNKAIDLIKADIVRYKKML